MFLGGYGVIELWSYRILELWNDGEDVGKGAVRKEPCG